EDAPAVLDEAAEDRRLGRGLDPRDVADDVGVDDGPEAAVVVDRARRAAQVLSTAVGDATGIRLVVEVLADLPVEAGLEHVVAEGIEEIGERRPALVTVEVQLLDEAARAAGIEADHVAGRAG